MNKHQLKIPLKNSWGELRLIPGKKGDSFEDIELPPVGKFDDWGKDNSQIKIRMDDPASKRSIVPPESAEQSGGFGRNGIHI